MGLEQQLRDEWKSIDKSDKEALRIFFTSYKFLTISDFCIALDMYKSILNRYRKRAGVVPTNGRSSEQTYYELPPELEPGVDPYEDTKKWWKKHSAKFGYRKLARLAGIRDPGGARDKLKKHGIQNKPKKPKAHKCDNYKWLHKYHVRLGYGIRRMAKLAGVNMWTISTWLMKHKIKRDRETATHMGENISQQNTAKD